MDDRDFKRLKAKAYQLYTGGDCQILIFEGAKITRHEDKSPGYSGTWVDASVFVPDDPPVD